MPSLKNLGRGRSAAALAAMAAIGCFAAGPSFDVTPRGPVRLPASNTKFIQFHIVSRVPAAPVSQIARGTSRVPVEAVTAEFRLGDAAAAGSVCRIQILPGGSIALEGAGKPTRRGQSNGQCAVGSSALSRIRADGSLDATIPISFQQAGRYQLYLRTQSGSWTSVGSYQLDTDGGASLPIQVLGVTPTQAVLDFMPPADGSSCQIQVTATQTAGGFDYTHLVPDTDPSIFPGADNASAYDAVNAPQNRGFSQADGSLAIVVGERIADYSPNTYKMHSRALQTATQHEAWISCGSSSGVVDFTTANIMTGISYTDPVPADPDRPGSYRYPTMSWTNRGEGVVDPQTGVMLHVLTLPTDSMLGQRSPWIGNFGSPIAGYPNRTLPAPSLFLPVNLAAVDPSWGFVVDQYHGGWDITEPSLLSFLPGPLVIGCAFCFETPVTVCLTADGTTCAVDLNVAADPNAAVDPNANTAGVLGITMNCTGICTFPSFDPRWGDTTPVLAAWHPNYSSGTPVTVVPSFQFDSVKTRSSPVQCDGSANVSRGSDQYGNFLGAPFNPIWKPGTPVLIDSNRHTIKQIIDENSIVLNESCPSNAQTLTANTFGLLILASVPLTGVVSAPWTATLGGPEAYWDAGGDLTSYTNCSKQPVIVGGVSGWHCTAGAAAYWIAADGSAALPMGFLGIANPGNYGLGPSTFCSARFWDDLDANSVFCLAPVAGKPTTTLVQLKFYGDHSGLATGTFPSPDTASGGYLPLCRSTNPVAPDNCWTVKVLNATGTNSPLVIEDAIRTASPDAWNNSAFPAAYAAGAMSTTINSKLDDSHLIVTTEFGQNSYGFTSILELSSPRGTVKLRAVLPSWRQVANSPPGSSGLRWAGIHGPNGSPWGGTKLIFYPTFLRGGSGTGQGYFISNVVSSVPAICPSGLGGGCINVTVDGQPGDPDPSSLEPTNDPKTNKIGNGYLQDLAPGDLLCAPTGNNNGNCMSYIAWGTFEDLRVLATSTNPDGTVILTLQRNLGGSVSTALAPGQQLFTMPSFCDYSTGYGCGLEAMIWDYSTGYLEEVTIGGQEHQFSAFDPVHNQMVNATAGSDVDTWPLCYSSDPSNYPNCYSSFFGPINAAKPVNSQLSSLSYGVIAQNPPFGAGTGFPGITGMGTPNDVDSHPSMTQMAAAPDSEKIWFSDARPFLGRATVPLPAPVQTAVPNVYKWATSDPTGQSNLGAYKLLPVMGSCGISVLRDVTTISTQTPYSYCVAVNGGDCTAGSSPGDVFVSCPGVNPAAPAKQANSCPYSGIGNYTPEVRDTCLSTSGGYAMSVTQVGFASQTNGMWSALTDDQRARSARVLTHGLSNYRIIDQFWNTKATPDGGLLLFRVPFMNGYATQIVMAKVPPFPDVTQDPLDRRGFIPTPVAIDPAPDGTTSVKVQFGYDPTLRCISRNEPCEARADFDPTGASTPFYFASENGPVVGLDCSNGCPASVNLPGISQRVIFYQAVFQVNGSPVVGTLRVTVVPDPLTAPGGSSGN